MTLSLEVVSCVNAASHAALDAVLDEGQFYVIPLDGSAARDKASFLARVANDWPLAEGLGAGNWDAMADALWGGLQAVGKKKIALVWLGADQMLEGALQDFLHATRILADLAAQVAGTLELVIVLVGDSPMFPPLP